MTPETVNSEPGIKPGDAVVVKVTKPVVALKVAALIV